MPLTVQQKQARIILSLISVTLTVVAPLVDLNASHLLHPDWPMHARQHMLWAVLAFSMLGGYSLYLLWVSPWSIRVRLQVSILINFIINIAFVASAASMPLYGGGLADNQGGVPSLANGWDANLLVVAAMMLLLIVTLRLQR